MADASDSNKILKGPALNTSNTTKWLTQAGTWTTPTAANVGAAPSAGANTIATVGTVTTGTWNATKIALKYGGTGVDGTSTAINTVFAGPGSGSAGNASFRSLVAADLPTVTIAKGGTNITSYAIGQILYCSAANTLSKLDGNTTTTRKFLRSVAATAGTAVAPTWDTVTKTDVGLSNVTNDAQIPKSVFTEGYQLLYSTGSSAYSVLTANKSTTKKFLTMTGASASAGAAPAWSTIAVADLPTVTVAKGGLNKTGIAIYAMLYASAKDTYAELAPNTTTTKKFVSMTGTGSAGAAPAWSTVSKSDVGLGNVTNDAQLPLTGGTLSGSITVERSTYNDAGSYIKLTSNSKSVGLHVGSGGANRGVYDWTKDDWVVYTDSSNNVILNGNATTATTAAALAPTGADSFTTNSSGNFKHKRSTNTDYWSLQNNAGTAKFSFYWETGNATFAQDLTCRQIYLNAYGGSYGTGGQACFWYNGDSGVTASGESASRARVDKAFQATKVYNAVWNDYAECRQVETEEPGYCVTESSSGIMIKTTKRLQAGCKITSDTFGTCMGETSTARTPIAVAGRVLAYPYRDRKEYELGAAVCSAPNGTIDIMTRDEIMMYPERIIGTVSEIPSYDIWHCGERGKDEIKVNGRIWIYVR